MSYHSRLIALFSLVAFFPINNPLGAQTQPIDRITTPVEERQALDLPGNLNPLARPEYDSGIAAPGQRMDRMLLVLQPDPAQQSALQVLLAAQQDPQSPEYHQWLTPERFGQLFGVSDHDLNQVLNWLDGHGFQVEPVSAGRRTVVFSGTAAQVESAFQTQIHVYNVNGQKHYANSTNPSIPLALSAVVNGVASLNDFHANPLHYGFQPLSGPAPQYSSGATHYMAPADFATIYDAAALYSSSIDGTGQSIAVLGRSNIALADVTAFRGTFGLPANNPTVVLNGPNPGIVSSSEQTEAELDVEWAGAVAKNAAIEFVLSASTNASDGVLLSAQYAVNQNVAPVITLSFGQCEAAMGVSGNQVWNSLWQQAAAQGTTVLVAAGDSGAAGCDTPSENTAAGGAGVNGLCSSPYSTCVGGTQFNDTATPTAYWSAATNPSTYGSALSYIPEVVWNSSASTPGGSELWATGGGASGIYSKPAWQAGTGVPADNRRDVPDVSLTASTHDGYLMAMNGQIYLIGGTSASTPAFAGLMAMAVESAGSRQGNANPTLYGLAASQWNGGTAVFHDITTGNNSVPGQAGFTAGIGYDLASGLGSVDAFQLINHWSNGPTPTTPGFQVTTSAPSLVVAPGASSTVRATVSVRGGFNSTVTFMSGALPAGLTANFAPPSLSAPGSGSSLLKLSASAGIAAGSYNLSFNASGGGISQTFALAVTVQSPCSYTINPSSATATAAGGNLSAVVTAPNGCSWTVSSTVSWISVLSGASGSGNGAFLYSVAPNTSAASRSGSLTIANQSLSVTEAAAAPSGAPLTPSSAAFSSAGGHGSVTVTLPSPTAYWSATSNSSWITIVSGATSANGNTTVTYSVAANTGVTRTGNITIAGLAFPVTQAGNSCSYGISLGQMTATTGGLNDTVSISTQPACPWSGSSNVSWITVTSASSGAGPGALGFFIANNTNSATRTGVLSVAGYSIQVTEGPKGNFELGKPIKLTETVR